MINSSSLLTTPYTSPNGVFTPNYTYSIVSILYTKDGKTDSLPYKQGKININSSTGAITFDNHVNYFNAKYKINVFVSLTNNNLPYNYNYNSLTVSPVSCFNYDTKILCLNKNLEEEYVPIQQLRRGDFVKSYLHGYRKIDCIGQNRILNDPTHMASCMFKMEKTEENGLIEDLIVTGTHSIMVDKLSERQAAQQKRYGLYKQFDNKKLLAAGISPLFQPIQNIDVYTYYHFTLENDGDNDKRFGVWANGMLTETSSKNRFLDVPFEKLEYE